MLYLEHPSLGRLDLDCADGFVVSSFTIGYPQVREVAFNKALADGTIDTTTYVGARAVTIALRLDNTGCPGFSTQDLIDLVSPYVSPRIRPRLVYTVEKNSTNPNHVRSLILRGADAPLTVDAPKALTLVCQWVAAESFTSALDDVCAVAEITEADEFGRTYDLDFDRDYPFSPPVGITLFYPVGNAPMDWTGTITAQVTDPIVTINNVDVIFTGVSLIPGQTINIDTRNRTILRNNDPNDSIYGLANFQDWTWDDLRVRPGTNFIRLEAASYVPGVPSTILRTNLCTNPSFEVDTAGWTWANFTTLSRSPADAFSGAFSLQAVATSNDITNGVSYEASVVPNQTLTASAYVKNVVGATRDHRIEFQFFDSIGTILSNPVSAAVSVTAGGPFQRLSLTATAPANAAFYRMRVLYQRTNAVIGNTTLVDAVLIEETNTLTSYFDGNTTPSTYFYEWTGTANDSTSNERTFEVEGPSFTLCYYDRWHI